MSLKPNYSSRSRSERVADECARIDPRGEIAGYSCWGAVLYVLYQKNVISRSKFQSMLSATTPDAYEDLFPRECPAVQDARGLQGVPRGSLLGFFKQRDGRFFLAHAMIYAGNGEAYGLNNGAIGQTPAWARIRLSDPGVAHWGAPLSFSYAEVGARSRVSVQVRYRDIDDMNRLGCVIM